LSTTNSTRPDTGSNPGRRDGKPATNRLSYGEAWLNTNSLQVLISHIYLISLSLSYPILTDPGSTL
jgi:hypothetical protein